MSEITKSLIEMIKDQSELSPDGFHGVDHWARVLANGRRLAPETGANLHVVELFSVFHDSRRFNEGHDPEHGARGAEFAAEMRGTWFNAADDEMDLLVQACQEHSDGHTQADITVQTCWDADRLDLGRVGITPDPKYLCTDVAKDPAVIEWAHRRAINSRSEYVRNVSDVGDGYRPSPQGRSRSVEVPDEIAADLISDMKIPEAIQVAAERIAQANETMDNYQLSIWRQVRTILRGM